MGTRLSDRAVPHRTTTELKAAGGLLGGGGPKCLWLRFWARRPRTLRDWIWADSMAGGLKMGERPEYTVIRLDGPDWEQVPAAALRHMDWLAPCAVAAKAQACHDGANLWVRMEAEETAVRATLTGALDPVCDDSCLEFFFAPDGTDCRYFNFEFNPLGTINLGFGAERSTRVRQIVKHPEELFRPEPFYTKDGWGIVFRIPADFIRLYMPSFALTGVGAGNFYKCGDKTQTPHYLAWAPLSSAAPDYHRRQDFGILRFA